MERSDQRGVWGRVAPRCTPAHARAASDTAARLARPPARAGGQPAVAVRLLGAAIPVQDGACSADGGPRANGTPSRTKAGAQPHPFWGPGLDAGVQPHSLTSVARREESRSGPAAGRSAPLSVAGRLHRWEDAQGRLGRAATDSGRVAQLPVPTGALASGKVPVRGYWGREKRAARAERSGAGAFRVCPLGGGGRGKGAASTGVLLPRPGGQEWRLAA